MTTSQNPAIDDIFAALDIRFPEASFQAKPLLLHNDLAGDQWFTRVEPAILFEVMQFLRDDPATKFEQLADLTCVDYLDYPDATDRYGVVYTLLSITHNRRLWIKAYVNDPTPTVPSVTSLWKGADWMEREVFVSVRRRLRRPPRPAADPHLGHVRGPSAPQGLPPPRPRRANQLRDRHAQ